MNFIRCSFLSMAVLTTIGCGGGGPQVQPVTGKITVDGAPLAGVSVTLIGDGGSAMGLTGITDGTGAFAVSAAGGYEGAPAGKYKILLNPPAPEMDYSTGKGAKAMEFPPQYSNPSSGELSKVEVGSEPVVVNIDVKTK